MTGKAVDAPRQLSRLKLGHRIKIQARLELFAAADFTNPTQCGAEMKRRLALSEGNFYSEGACDRPVDRAQTAQSVKAKVFAQSLNHPMLPLRIEPYGQIAAHAWCFPTLLQHNGVMLPNPTVFVNNYS